MTSLVPSIFELPFIEFGGAPVYLLADLAEGARVSWSAVDGLEVLNTNVIDVGAMLVVVGPEHARHLRPLKVKPAANALELAKAPYISIGPLEIPVLVDAELGVQATITRGMFPGGPMVRVPVVPAGSLVALLPPQLAAQVRILLQRAEVEIRRQQNAGGLGGDRVH